MLISGYRYLDRKIPDEIPDFQRQKKTEDVTEVLSTPRFVTFEEAVTVSQGWRLYSALVNFWVIFHLKK